MAREAVELIKKAESDAAQITENARVEAVRIIETAQNEASAAIEAANRAAREALANADAKIKEETERKLSENEGQLSEKCRLHRDTIIENKEKIISRIMAELRG